MDHPGAHLLQHRAVLLIQAQLQRLFTITVQGQQIEVTICAPVQHASTVIDRRIDQRMRRAAIFRLHVINNRSQRDVCVVPEYHSSGRPHSRLSATCHRLFRFFTGTFDPVAPESLL